MKVHIYILSNGRAKILVIFNQTYFCRQINFSIVGQFFIKSEWELSWVSPIQKMLIVTKEWKNEKLEISSDHQRYFVIWYDYRITAFIIDFIKNRQCTAFTDPLRSISLLTNAIWKCYGRVCWGVRIFPVTCLPFDLCIKIRQTWRRLWESVRKDFWLIA